ncbi:uncharacterized protein LOC117328890 [Pecten maximus]|uniref:uncharacterized protein LOC117328890 n=1 Tax=Pecten maximus TaxID=6579 RepID=UPI00145869F6|nr:uncharacterized protein LOC117328890 [Pecten maximus]XP_033742382.1 uncharacterized protein LOC117328890 [Pecten maximus]
MSSEEVKDDLEVPSESIMDLRGKIDNLREVNLDLNANLEKRRNGLKEAGNKIQQMSSNMHQFQMTLAAIDTHVQDNRSRMLDLDRMNEELQREKNDINTELRFLSSKDAWAELASSRQQWDEEDLATEKRLTDWARSDLFAKLDDLDRAKRRYSDKVADTKKQWEMYKDEAWKGQMETKAYLDDIDGVNDQIVSRFKSLLKYGGQGLGDTERESITDTIRAIGIESELRAESEKCLDTQMFSLDIEEEIEQLLRHREQMWEQNASLMDEICSLQSQNQGETIIPLKHSNKHIDLPNRDVDHQRRHSEAEDSEGQEAEHIGGGISLHKCVKLTDLSRLYKEPEKLQPAMGEIFTAQDAQLDAEEDQLDMDSATGGHDEPPPPQEEDSENEEDEPEPDESPEQSQQSPVARGHHHHMENTCMSDLMVSKIRGRTLGSNVQTAHKDAETVTGHSLATTRRPSAFSFTPVQRSSRSKR